MSRIITNPGGLAVALITMLVVVGIFLLTLDIRSRLRESPPPEATINLHQKTIMENNGSTLTETWMSGTTEIEVITICGFNYDGTPIEGGETKRECKARHETRS